MRSGSSCHFTEEEMRLARETDLPTLLTSLGYRVKRIGRYHTTAEMDGLRIKDRRTWFRYSENTGGDAIDFLRRFCGKSFPEAVEYLLAFHGRARGAPSEQEPNIQEDESPKPFALPPRNTDDRRVFAYLRKRGIAPRVIRRFLESGLLYEDAVHHNCVFVGRDGSGQARYAGLRGTYDRDGKGFRGDVSGSEKDIGFSIPYDAAIPAGLGVRGAHRPYELSHAPSGAHQRRGPLRAVRRRPADVPAGASWGSEHRPVPGRRPAGPGGRPPAPGEVQRRGLHRDGGGARRREGLERVPAKTKKRRKGGEGHVRG